ncbi:acyl-CoA-binding domain-containing protein 4 [Tanacetum coccineum]
MSITRCLISDTGAVSGHPCFGMAAAELGYGCNHDGCLILFPHCHQHVSQPTAAVGVNRYAISEGGAHGDAIHTANVDTCDLVLVLGSVGVYNLWFDPPISDQGTKLRYEHATTIVDDKVYLFGGNHNGRQLNDIQVTALRNKKHESQERVCLAQSCGEYGRVNFSSVGELGLDYRRAWMGSTSAG